MQILLPDDVQWILQKLNERGYSAYVVGGCIRNTLLGITPSDWDICTAATPIEIASCFSDQHIIKTGQQHGTLTVILHGIPYEITTYRCDGAYADHRHPDSVSFTMDIHDDLRRRDFTMNSMAFHPETGLLDCFGGASDIGARLLRCVGDPDTRFQEDALRILRALRFASVLGFSIEQKTAIGLRAQLHLLTHIASERIASELDKLLLGDNVLSVLSGFSDALAVTIPEILPCVNFDQHSKYHHLPVWEHICLSVQNSPKNRIVRLALLLHDIGKPHCFTIGDDGYGHFYGHPDVGAEMAESILRRLRYDTDTVTRVVCLIRHHDAALTATKPAVCRWLNRLGPNMLGLLLSVKRADASAHKDPSAAYAKLDDFTAALAEVLRTQACFSLSDLAANGNDLLRLQIPAGPIVGRILQQLLSEVMEDMLPNEREALLLRAKVLAHSADIGDPAKP